MTLKATLALATTLIAMSTACIAAPASMVTRMTGYSPDGTGAQIIVSSTSAMTLDAQTATTLKQDVMEEFLKLHPQQSTTVQIGQDADGRIVATAVPYAVPSGGQTTTGGGTGPQPPTPPPPGIDQVPDFLAGVDYHVVNYNGWNRDTSYSRTVTPLPNNGGWSTGPWGDAADHVYPTPGGGGGANACGASGQRPCPQPY